MFQVFLSKKYKIPVIIIFSTTMYNLHIRHIVSNWWNKIVKSEGSPRIHNFNHNLILPSAYSQIIERRF